MTFMVTSGAIYYFASIFGTDRSATVSLIKELHQFFGNLAWAYLVGHAGMALIHHFFGHMSLSVMWSLRKRS